MVVSYMDFTDPNVKYTYDLGDNLLYKKDNQNYINALGKQQLNTIGNVFLLDVFLTNGNMVEPHYHQNASELLYCISGAAVVSFINPFTNELMHFSIKPGQVADVPQGWWHYAEVTTDNTHLLAIHDTPLLQTVFGSDILRLTPPQVLARAYCLDENKVKDTLSPIKETVIIGPPSDCHRRNFSPDYHRYIPIHHINKGRTIHRHKIISITPIICKTQGHGRQYTCRSKKSQHLNRMLTF